MNDDGAAYEARRTSSELVAEARPAAAPRAEQHPVLAPPPTRRRTGWMVLAALAIILATAAAIWLLPRPGLQAPAAGRFTGGPMPVVAASVTTGDMPIVLQGLGAVAPLANVTVRPQVGGPLTQIAFREGQMVQKGDLLAEIDPRPFQLALDQAQAQLMKDQALLKNAELDLARYQKLLAQDSISRQQRDTQEYLVHQYEGTVKGDQALVDNAKLNLSYCRILAPIGGRVGLRQIDAGNVVQTNDPNGIVVITQIKPISVVFTLPEDALAAVMKRLREGASLPVAAYDRSHTAIIAKGMLASVDNQMDTGTGTVKLRAQFANDDEALFPNQFVNAELSVDLLRDVTLAPTSAVQRGAPGTYVYVVKDDGTVTVRPVTLGPGEGQRVAIQSGLAAGDKVVVDGADRLREGAKVTLPSAAAAPTAPPAASPAADGQRRGPGGPGQGGPGQGGQTPGGRSRSTP